MGHFHPEKTNPRPGIYGTFSLLKYSSHQFLLCFQVNVKFYDVTKWPAAGQYSEKTN